MSSFDDTELKRWNKNKKAPPKPNKGKALPAPLTPEQIKQQITLPASFTAKPSLSAGKAKDEVARKLTPPRFFTMKPVSAAAGRE